MAKAAKTVEHHFGLHAVESLLSTMPEQVLGLFVLQGRDDERLQALVKQAEPHGISVQKASRDTLSKMSEGAQHQGIVAAVRPAPVSDEGDLERLVRSTHNVFLLALDQVTDPHNLGACMRTAAAMGVHGVIAPRDRAAGLTPIARKVAAGAAEVIPFFQVTNLSRTLVALQEMGVQTVGTMLDESAKPLHQIDLTGALTIVMGAEDTGLRRLTQENCDQLAYIPMAGTLQSLNVSVATGMAIYEACRQRQPA
ncbi:23S rRNA (guanosine(2251)-2'-O)-methyltransferase RlmB [Aquirhabdus sp.]|uniref:23S rRNA (guanosine(2251)-2'-O)-methyltransferase RlmB n=1 Tax=Aquirhabdus sp. TaxID=2824160 RepID=UPI00396D00FE